MKQKMKWKFSNIPDQTGKVAIVTGANSGLGFAVTTALARKGAQVIMACRSRQKAEKSLQNIVKKYPDVKIEIILLDLANLSSIRNFTTTFLQKYDQLDILCNNAGVMGPPYQKTIDGFELQFGTNHLGHFALTGLLIGILNNTMNSRIVTMSSLGHKFGKLNFEDLNSEKKYSRGLAYAHSKLANLLFVYELQRKFNRTNKNVMSVASHPGWTRTNIPKHNFMIRLLSSLLGMNAEKGALSMLFAATSPDAEKGTYYGPSGPFEIKGYPKKVNSTSLSHDTAIAKRLWEVSEELTGVTYPF